MKEGKGEDERVENAGRENEERKMEVVLVEKIEEGQVWRRTSRASTVRDFGQCNLNQ